MGWLKNMVRNWLDIKESPGVTVAIQEYDTFESNNFKNQLWFRGNATELHQFYTQVDDGMGKSKFWSAVATDGINFRKIHTGLPSLIVETLSDIVIDNLNYVKITNNEEKQKIWEEIQEENNFKDIVKQAIEDILVQRRWSI